MERNLLPSNVVPSAYKLRLEPDLVGFTFDGQQVVDIEIKEETDTITLHSVEIEISKVVVTTGDGAALAESPVITYDTKAETASFKFASSLKPCSCKLEIIFKGCLNDKMAGFYRSKCALGADGIQKYMAITQFEPTDARKAFPCWDEPAKKATFSITMRTPAGLESLGNMPVETTTPNDDGSADVTFGVTPIMSTYLVAFCVGEFEYIQKTTKQGVDVKVYTPHGLKHEGEFALSVAVATLDYFSEFFAQPYPLPKLDMIAIADFAAGAMENWGLVTYRSTALLYNPERTSLKGKMRVGYVVCHELAHQWFGNLVTMEWWTHLWLNEGFATWVGWLAVDHIFPEWCVWDQFVGGELERALELDSLRSSHAIEVECKNSADVGEIFDAISYSKGASVIRMLADMIGFDAFKRGLQAYLQKHKYSNASSTDLWEALSTSSGQDVSALMQGWTKQTGFPLVSLSLNTSNNIVASQQRFFATGADETDTTMWPIKFGFEGNATFPATKLETNKETTTDIVLKDGQWLKANKHMNGIFRVKYEAALLARLSPHISTLDTRDRYEIISDLFSLSKSGFGDTADPLKLLPSYNNETTDVVLSIISQRLGELQSVYFEEPEQIQSRLQEIVLEFFLPIAARLTWQARDSDNHSDALVRSMAIERCALGNDPNTVQECQARFERFVAGDADAIFPDLRGAVFKTVLKFGGKDELTALLKIYREAPSADMKVTVLSSIGRSRLPEVHQLVIDFMMGGEVRDQDVTTVIAGLGHNPTSRVFLWQWFKSNFEQLHAKFYKGSFLMGRIITYTCSDFATEAMATEIEDFFDSVTLEKDAIKRAIKQCVESVRANAKWLDASRQSVSEFLMA
eukprot:m.36408 g.36408  ORF g.36408 m.36408 type:complete len:859 (-) comp17353_c0_seq2:231-2807(-)